MDVRARAARLLGDGEVAVDRLVLELVHVTGLERGATVVVEDAPVHVGRVVQVHAHAARAARELLLHAEDLQLVEAPAAVLHRQVEAVQVVVAGEVVEPLRKPVRHLDLGLHLLEGALCERPDLQQVGLESFVGDRCLGIHGPLLLSRFIAPIIRRPRRPFQFRTPLGSRPIDRFREPCAPRVLPPRAADVHP